MALTRASWVSALDANTSHESRASAWRPLSGSGADVRSAHGLTAFPSVSLFKREKCTRACGSGRAGGGLWGGSPCSTSLVWGRWGALGTAAARLRGKEGLSWHEGVGNKCSEMTPALFTGKNRLVWRVREVKASCEIQLCFRESFFEDVLFLLLCGSS